jgi:hypothetical protein
MVTLTEEDGDVSCSNKRRTMIIKRRLNRLCCTATVLVGLTLPLGACGLLGEASDESGDTMGVQCDGICNATLYFEFATARSDFMMTLSAPEFNQLQVACPDGVFAGGPGTLEISCEDNGFTMIADGYLFPDTFTATVDRGAEFEIAPDYSFVEMCGTTCNVAVVVID